MRLFRKEIEGMEPYGTGEDPLPVKLDQNESPWDWPRELKEEALDAVRGLAFHRYPPREGVRLAGRIAERWGLPEEAVVMGNGSDELLLALFLTALDARRTLLLPSPSFALYGVLARISGPRVRRVPMREGVAYDPGAWIEAVRRERPHLALVCSPNNPTGAVFPSEALPELLRAAPGLVAVDEAYGEFAGESAAGLLPGARNLVVLRTFSKALGSAGLRLGYLLAAPEAARQVRKGLPPHAVSPVTGALGAALMAREEIFLARAERIVRERGRLYGRLRRIPGVTAYPSRANFLLVRFPPSAAGAVYRGLKERGVLVRDVSGQPGLEGCLRLTVGAPEENDALLKALEGSCWATENGGDIEKRGMT